VEQKNGGIKFLSVFGFIEATAGSKEFQSLSTTWRTSDRHHSPLGFFTAQLQPPVFFSFAIFSRINERRLSR